MSHSADFDLLLARVRQQAGTQAAKQNLESLLNLGEEGYAMDDPRSVNRHLRILSIQFAGVKQTGEEIAYECSPGPGVNLWLGENLVGKSSIFKIVKLALTGRKSIDRGIEKWLHEIWVEFTLGYEIYTSYIYRKANNLIFNLYQLDKEQLLIAGDEERQAAELYHGGMEGYAEHLEEFFFTQFAYYPMQWVSKTSVRTDPKSYARETSWVTYFSTIYLAAEEYDKLLYGHQASLVLQMILGLEFTYSINRLNTKKSLKESELGLLSFNPSTIQTAPAELEAARVELQQVNDEIRALRQTIQAQTAPATDELNKKLEAARLRYQNSVIHSAQLTKDIGLLTTQDAELDRQESDYKRRIKEYKTEITRKKKRARDLQDYADLGAFFTSLEVKTCPSCNHEVERTLVQHEKETGSCRLCNHQVQHQTSEPGAYDKQINNLLHQADELYLDQYNAEITFQEIKDKRKALSGDQEFKNNTLAGISLPHLLAEVNVLEQQVVVKSTVFDVDKAMQRTAELAVKKNKLDEQLKAYSQPNGALAAQQQNYKQQIYLLSVAIQELEQMREERSAALIQRLADLYLEQLHAFGLVDYEKVTITDKFKITYQKLEDEYPFEELTAGEQLRAKLGLYIAVIQLDVQECYGRHPRFIILDSPAKEEADAGFIEGLKKTFSYIEDNMADQLQVFVGTTVRTLATVVDGDKVDERGGPDEFGNPDYFF
jgi:hypothetical protein